MLLILALVPPAIVQPAVAAPRTFGTLTEALEEIAEAYIEGNEAGIPAHLGNARKLWEHAKRNHAQVLTEQEIQAVERNLDAIPALKPRFQAESALQVAGMICGRMRPSHSKASLEADLATMLAWCRVEARCWEQMPNVAEAFQPLLERLPGKRPNEARQITEYLGMLQEDLARKSVSGAKRDLRRLLELIDQAGKP